MSCAVSPRAHNDSAMGAAPSGASWSCEDYPTAHRLPDVNGMCGGSIKRENFKPRRQASTRGSQSVWPIWPPYAAAR